MTIAYKETCITLEENQTSSSSKDVKPNFTASEIACLCNKDIKLLPECVTKTSTLKVLDASYNYLGYGDADNLLTEFASRDKLTDLNLSANELKKWPRNLKFLTTLEVLSLSGNELDCLPEDISQLTSLQRFHADFNLLRLLPVDWSQLTNLTTLTLSNNRLEEVPTTIWTLQSLETLDLQQNRISTMGILPQGAAKSLKKLHLSRNNLRGHLDLSILVNLNYLDVSCNDLEQLYVSPLQKITFLSCCQNNLKTLHIHGAEVAVLKASRNDLRAITCEYPPVSLEVLEISENGFQELPNWILLSKNLRKLSAHRNELVNLPSGLFSTSLSYLETVELNNNMLKRFADFSSLHCIRTLCLQYNKIEELPNNFFATSHCIEFVNLSYNQLKTLPPAADCSTLRVFLLSGNQLNDTSSLESLLQHKNLEILHLADNGIVDIPERLWSTLPCLTELSLACNNLTKISSHVLKMIRLKKLFLHSNQITVLPPLLDHANLMVLDIANNNLNELQLSTVVPVHLTSLDLSANQNLHIDPKEFQQLCAERSVAIVDVNSAGRTVPSSISSAIEDEGSIPWILGFTETQEGNTRLYIEFQRDVRSGCQEALMVLMEMDDIKAVSELRQALPNILKAERECQETLPYFLRNALLSCVRFLHAKNYGPKLGITMCHLASSAVGPVTLRIATIGCPSSCILGRSGNVIILAQRDDMEPVNVEEWETKIQEASVYCLNHNTAVSKNTFPKGKWGAIPNPEVRELVLSPQDRFLVFSDNAFSRTLIAEEIYKQIQTSTSPVAAAKALAEKYSALANGKRECIAVIMLPGSQKNTDDDVEKYRCWEFMLEQNHKLLFTKELETIHKTILRNGKTNGQIDDPSSWCNIALSKYKCPLPSHRGRYYCYGNKFE